jgi:hypothetical protein
MRFLMPKECCIHRNLSIHLFTSQRTFSLLLKHICIAMAAFGCGLSVAAQTMRLQSGTMTAVLNTRTAALHLIDSKTGRSWDLGIPLVVPMEGQPVPITPEQVSHDADGSLRFKDRTSELLFTLSLLTGNAPRLQYAVNGLDKMPSIKEVDLISDGLLLEGAHAGYYAIPASMGIMVDPLDAKPGLSRYDAYQVSHGYSMAMLGAVERSSALLIYWNSPDVSILTDASSGSTKRLTASIALQAGADTLFVEPLGRGDYVSIAKAYRTVAKQEGLLKTVTEKEAVNPKIADLVGVPDFKLMVYEHRLARDGSDHVTTTLDATFADEAALAHHLKYDVGIDHALMVLEGWNHAGYDNQLPDILPAAAPAGGNAGLAVCSKQVRDQGWLFGLHDNYQDMYFNAPSWDPSDIVEKKDGSLMKGGFWAGGQAYFICSRESVKLLSRPQNLPEVMQLFHPDAYFLDTVFASPLRFCYDPRHPTNRLQDMQARQSLCDAVRQQDVLFGSEEGNEQGIAHADYFEGMLSTKTRSHQPNSEVVIPLFELVYGDAIPIYTHQADKLSPEDADQFLDLILYAEMPNYYTPSHVYWRSTNFVYNARPEAQPSQLVFSQGSVASNRVDSFIRNTYEVLRPLSLETVNGPMTDHSFLTADHTVEMSRFGKGLSIVVNHGNIKFKNNIADLPPYGFYVDSPNYQAFYATRFHAMTFSKPTMMTVLCGKQESGMLQSPRSTNSCRVFHAFGDSHVKLFGKHRDLGDSNLSDASR